MTRFSRRRKWFVVVGAIILLLGILLVIQMLWGTTPVSSLTVTAELECEDSRYITITNTGSATVSLDGWTIENDRQPYILSAITLAPGTSIRVWSGTGTDDSGNVYIGRATERWHVKNGSLSVQRSPDPWYVLSKRVDVYFLGCTYDLMW
jgi:hypothetical protein